MKEETTKEMFMKALSIEDDLDALENGYYDTHDLDSIQLTKEEDEETLLYFRKIFKLKENEFFYEKQYDEL